MDRHRTRVCGKCGYSTTLVSEGQALKDNEGKIIYFPWQCPECGCLPKEEHGHPIL